jgi:two-component system heavy metal sensor histidine kinase CusS
MISDMLFLAKSEHGLLTLKKDILELGHDLDELLEFFEPLASENKMELIRQGDGQLMGDRAMLRRAFSNLISNAIRYTPAGSRIIIRIKTDEDGVQVDVINPGKPIPEEQLSRIFDRFYRADAARTHHSEGAGLGLAITRSIIEAHGGFLSAKSTEYETIFSATFPHHNDEPD